MERNLHSKCGGCMKSSWIYDYCEVLTTPKEVWKKGDCWSRTEDPNWEKHIEQTQTQHQQSRCPGIEEDIIGWLMGSKPPSITDREPILHLPAPAAKGGGNKSGKRKRKKPLSIYNNPFI